MRVTKIKLPFSINRRHTTETNFATESPHKFIVKDILIVNVVAQLLKTLSE